MLVNKTSLLRCFLKGEGNTQSLMKTPIQSAPLTKKFLMSATKGLFLVSNVGRSPIQPSFAEIVQPTDEREDQWKRIVACKANHRLCHLFKTPNAFLEFSSRLTTPDERN